MRLLAIGNNGRMEKYTTDKSLYKRFQISYVSLDASDEELLEIGKDAEFILADSMAKVSSYVIDNMPNLKMIHVEGVGYNGIDTEAARNKRIYVCNCKGINSAAVAEQAVLLMLGLLRDICNGDKGLRTGRQAVIKESYMREGNLKELGECTIGIIGFGDIGKATARLVGAFGAKVVYYDRFRADQETEKLYGVSFVDLDELLSFSDIVSIHVPVLESTKKMVNADFLNKMKKGSYFVNTARGELVNQKDLLEALRTGYLAGAGLDTVDGEPVQVDNPILNAGKEVEDKIIFSCHVGGITGSTMKRGYEIIWSDIRKAAEGSMPDHVVNPWN